MPKNAPAALDEWLISHEAVCDLELPVLSRSGEEVIASRSALKLAFCPTTSPVALYPEENRLCEGWSDGRRREFNAGRAAARKALAAAGAPQGPLPRCSNGAPQWPAHFTGSLSHTRDWAVAVAGASPPWRALGLDIERIGRVQPKLWRLLFQPSELDWLRGLPEQALPRTTTLLFSAKEAFYKLQQALGGGWLGFLEAEIQLSQAGDVEDLLAPTRDLPAQPLVLHLLLQQPIDGSTRFCGCAWWTSGSCLTLFARPEQSSKATDY